MSKKKLADWENYAKRTGRTLDSYLQRINSIEEALRYLVKHGLNPPSLEAIELALCKDSLAVSIKSEQSDTAQTESSIENNAIASSKKKNKKKYNESKNSNEEIIANEPFFEEEFQEEAKNKECAVDSEETAVFKEKLSQNDQQ
jgi:hypothetical protein